MNLTEMTIKELKELETNLQKQIAQRTRDDILAAKEKILAIASSVGMSIKDIVGSPTAQKEKSKVAVQYQHPEDAALQWTGRGRKPKWVVAWIESGKTMDEIRIKA